MKKNFILFLLLTIFLVPTIMAHCPLCTMGAGAAAAGAALIGVNKIVIGLFIGAFAMSMGLWLSRIIKKKFVPFQKILIVLLVFFTTVLPLLPIFSSVGPLYLSFIGEYGRTYAINYSLISSIFGGLIVFVSPVLSRKITKLRQDKIMPFQGIIITLSSLIFVGLIIQFIV